MILMAAFLIFNRDSPGVKVFFFFLQPVSERSKGNFSYRVSRTHPPPTLSSLFWIWHGEAIFFISGFCPNEGVH